jgi:hypothetical protein
MSTRAYGVDEARSSYLPWCKCGWRQLASSHTESRLILAEHRNSVHGDAMGEILKTRVKGVRS